MHNLPNRTDMQPLATPTMHECSADRASGGTPIAATTAPAPAPDFDPLALPRAVGSEPQVLARVLRAYLVHARSDMQQLQDAADSAQWPAAGLVAHRWKASSRAIGAARLAQQLDALERAVNAGCANMGDIAGGLPALFAVCTATSPAFPTELARRAAESSCSRLAAYPRTSCPTECFLLPL